MNKVAELIEEFGRIYSGDPWYGPSMREVLTGISAAEAAVHPLPAAHSVWDLVLHMTGWTEEVARRVEGGEPSLPQAGDWPALPVVSAATWDAALAGLESAHERLLRALEGFPEERLSEMVGDARDLPLGTGVSFEGMLRGLVQHHAYHTGQIALLKKALKE
ncbi:MAG TPA: DinB family protein [Thermoanaerobaculia bacterium]|nr:DinB family protein [Thermoanaerobaculia bacterium]